MTIYEPVESDLITEPEPVSPEPSAAFTLTVTTAGSTLATTFLSEPLPTLTAVLFPVQTPVVLAYRAPVVLSAQAVTTLVLVRLFAAVATPPITVAPAIKPITSLEIVLNPLIFCSVDI